MQSSHEISLEIESKIYLIRGEKVMLDHDLAELYGVPTMRLNEQVKRNPKRFPSDFMFRLSNQEFAILISQIAISSSNWGGRRIPPLKRVTTNRSLKAGSWRSGIHSVELS